MVSVMTASLAVGKVAQGLLYGRIGIRKGGLIMMGIFAAGFLALLSPALVWPGLILVAFGLGTYTTLLPQVTRRIFGSREYAAIWALIATAGSVGTFIANPVWGTIFDKTGSYSLALIGCSALLVVTMGALVKALKNTK
jgi:MFS family permease